MRDRRDGSSFSVARFGLSPTTADAITQHFARGGMVKKPKGYAEGGPVEPLTLPQQMQRIGLQALGPMIPAVGPAMSVVQAGEGLAQLRDPALRSKIATAAGDVATAINPVPELTNAIGLTKPGAPASPQTPPPQGSETAPLTVTQPETPQPQAGAPQPMPGSASMSLRMPSGEAPGYGREITEASKQAQAAEMDKARAAAEQAQAQAELAQGYQVKRDALAQEWEGRLAQSQARVDAMAADIATGKTDPSRFWNSRDTGQKVMASIGLILGGLGAGLAGGPNYAQQVIDKAIDKDIDAQEKDLGRKQNLLQHYVQQGHTLREAMQFAKADARDMYAAQLEANAAKYAGPIAQEEAKKVSAGIRRQAAIDRQHGYSDSLNNRVKLMELESKMASKNLARLVAPGFMEGAVPLKDEEKVKFRDAVRYRSDVGAGVAELRGLAKKYGTEAFPTDAGARMESIASDLLTTMGRLHELGALADADLKLMREQVPSFTGLKPAAWTGGLEKLDQLVRNIDRKVSSRASSMGLQRLEQPGAQGLVSVPRKP